jgi:hypothetical protein
MPPIRLVYDEGEMRTELAKHISVGMPLQTARAVMEKSGFECEDLSVWDLPLLRCTAVYQPWLGLFKHPMLADVIEVDLEHEGGKVKKVTVRCWCDGP